MSCMRVFHQSCRARIELMRVKKQEFRWELIFNCHTPVERGNEFVRVEKREFAWEFFSLTLMLHSVWWKKICQLSWSGQTKTRVERREFAWEFSQVSCSGQTRMRVNVHENFSQLSSTFVPFIWATSKVMRGDENWRSNGSENCNSYQLFPTVYNFHSISSSFHVIISQQTVVELSYVSYNQAYLRTVHFSWKMSFPKLAILITYGTNRISHWNMRK